MEQTTASRVLRKPTGATIKATVRCGCGWAPNNNVSVTDLKNAIHQAMDHAENTGHTLNFQGEVRGMERA